jgi:hypothetical protein
MLSAIIIIKEEILVQTPLRRFASVQQGPIQCNVHSDVHAGKKFICEATTLIQIFPELIFAFRCQVSCLLELSFSLFSSCIHTHGYFFLLETHSGIDE